MYKFIIQKIDYGTAYYAGCIKNPTNVWTVNPELASLFNSLAIAKEFQARLIARLGPSGRYSVRMVQEDQYAYTHHLLSE